jgi:Holliday junction resolvase RusA-like endonuclease
MYDPKESKSWKAQIAEQAVSQLNGEPLLVGPVMLQLKFFMPRPKNLPKKKFSYHTKRPDLSNLEKAVEDALNNVIIQDDSQIFTKHSSKMYATAEENPGVEIQIEQIE